MRILRTRRVLFPASNQESHHAALPPPEFLQAGANDEDASAAGDPLAGPQVAEPE